MPVMKSATATPAAALLGARENWATDLDKRLKIGREED